MLTKKLLKDVLQVRDVIIEDGDLSSDINQVATLKLQVRPSKAVANRCPICGKKCPGYDTPHPERKKWRHLDFGGVIVILESATHRISCPDHGVVTASVPWAAHDCSFTYAFDSTVAWMATKLNRTAVAEYMRIDWKTVGRCVHRVRERIEPDISVRFDGLRLIGIDETSYQKGHKYITVIINHETNTVVWAAKGHGKEVLKQFFDALTPEQRSVIKVVTADGAKWITECVEEYCPNATRCVDSFHVVEWINKALDDMRLALCREAQSKLKKLKKEHPQKPGRPKTNDEDAAMLAEARGKVSDLKNLKYPLGKAPENLTELQQLRLERVAALDPHLYRAYVRKEELRRILHMTDVDAAEKGLKDWLWWASHSRIPEFIELGKKIRRHRPHILNTIAMQVSNARVEAINNIIKLIIRRAFGFQNVENMISLVLLVCSNLTIPLPNRAPKKEKKANKAQTEAA